MKMETTKDKYNDHLSAVVRVFRYYPLWLQKEMAINRTKLGTARASRKLSMSNNQPKNQ
jgi:hypothetical protein